MGEDQNPIFCFKNQNLKFDEGRYEKEVKWVAAMEVNGSLEDLCGSESNANEESSLLEEDSADSGGSLCFSSDMADQEDASSSSSSSSRLMCSSSSSSSASLTNNQGPLYELSDLMAQLPMKRGLSKFYDGRSQSFTSLAGVRSLEDLVKKERPYNKRLKLCRSYGGGLDIGQSNKAYSPRATISKKVPNRGSSFLSSLGKRSPNSIATRPPVPVIRT